MATRRQHKVWLRIACGTAGIVVALGVALLALSLVLWRVDVGNASRVAAVLQASAAAAGLLGSGALVAVTAYYAWITAEILRQSAPDLSVELQRAWSDGVTVLRGPLDSPEEFAVDAGYTEPMFAVVVRNTGGAPVTVDSPTIELPDGFSYSVAAPTSGEHWPYRLDSHSSVTFFIPAPPGILTKIASVANIRRKVRATCATGSGEVRSSAWAQIPPDS